MKSAAVAARIQPAVRRVASSTSRMAAVPSATSIAVGVAERYGKAARSRIGQPSASTESATSAQSTGDGGRSRPSPPRREEQEGRGQGQQQEAGPIEVGVDDGDHPVQAVDRQRRSTAAASPRAGPRRAASPPRAPPPASRHPGAALAVVADGPRMERDRRSRGRRAAVNVFATGWIAASSAV